jgi:hypothetical protein
MAVHGIPCRAGPLGLPRTQRDAPDWLFRQRWSAYEDQSLHGVLAPSRQQSGHEATEGEPDEVDGLAAQQLMQADFQPRR